MLATLPSESDTLTTKDTSGEKLELTKGYVFSQHKDESVKEIVCIGVLEYIPGHLRGWFMDQCYRILVPEGKMVLTVPYWTSWRAYYDARFEWPPFCDQSFLCYDKKWREENMKDLRLDCDFDWCGGYIFEADTANRSNESRAFWGKHYTNSIDALQLTLTKRAKS